MDGTEPDAGTAARRGRKPASGRYATRAELCEAVWADWLRTPRCAAEIARAARVSPAVVSRIIDTGEGRPAYDEPPD